MIGGNESGVRSLRRTTVSFHRSIAAVKNHIARQAMAPDPFVFGAPATIGYSAMFERFTDRARKVMALANQEAQRFNHEYIGSEHILLGLIKEGSGVGAEVLKRRDVDLRKTRAEVEKMIRPGPREVSIGRLPQTPRAKKVIEYAIDEARRMGHGHVETEHILLGLVRESDGVAAQVLLNLGLKLEEVRTATLELIGPGPFPLESTSAPGEPVAAALSHTSGHPVARLYQDLIDGWSHQVEEYVADADFERAADAREQRNRLEDLRARLLKRLADDPQFAAAVLRQRPPAEGS